LNYSFKKVVGIISITIVFALLSQPLRAEDLIYDNSNASGLWYGPGSNNEVIDYGTSAGGNVVKFIFGYATEALYPGTITIRFYTGTYPDTCPGGFIASFQRSGLQGSPDGSAYGFLPEYVIPANDQFTLPGGKFGYSFSFSNSATGVLQASGGTGNENAFLLENCQLAWFGGSPWAGFYMKVYAEPLQQDPNICEIHGFKFNDINGDGLWDDANEPALPDWDIYLDLNDNGLYDTGEPNTVTGNDPNGSYEFLNLPAGTYIVAEMPQTGWTQTFPAGDGTHSVTLDPNLLTEPNTIAQNINFGNMVLVSGPKITGQVLFDGRALTGVTITGEPGNYVDVTDDDGLYEIMVADNWTGSVTAAKDRYDFNEVYAFSNLTSDTVADFTAYCLYSGGDGTEATPFQIADVVDLLAMRDNTSNYDKNFIQTADISLATAGPLSGGAFDCAVIARSTDGTNFNGVAFEGVYDGNGFTVSDLSIDATTSRYDYLGLFGKLLNGTIKNLNLVNFWLDGEYISHVGGVVGYNDGGTIRNCHSSVSMHAGLNSGDIGAIAGQNWDRGRIEKCSSSGSLSGTIDTVGGIAGSSDLYSVISDCNSTCSITGNLYLGGLVGVNSSGSEILNSYSTGNVTGSSLYYYVGGLAGDNDSLISACYATGTVTGRRHVGGLVGRNYFDGIIVNCYATGRVDGVENVGGLVGINEDIYEGVISNCYAAGDVSGTTAVGGLCGYNPDNHQANPAPIIVNCFWNTSVQTHGVSVGIGINNELILNVLGRTTSQMQTQSTFTDYGWDFAQEAVNGTENIWHMPFGTVGFPMLWWQRDIPGDWVGKYGVGMEDFGLFANCWMVTGLPGGSNPECDIANLNGDSGVNPEDLAIFRSWWMFGR